MNNYYLCNLENYHKYNCKVFQSFLEANDYHKINYRYKNNWSTIISINKYIPLFIHKYILHYKLSNIFINVNIEKNYNDV